MDQSENDGIQKRLFLKKIFSGYKDRTDSKTNKQNNIVSEMFASSLIKVMNKVDPEYYQRFKKTRTQSVGQIRKQLGPDEMHDFNEVKDVFRKNVSTFLNSQEEDFCELKNKLSPVKETPKIPFHEQKKWSSKNFNSTGVFHKYARVPNEAKSGYINNEKYLQSNPVYTQKNYSGFFNNVYK